MDFITFKWIIVVLNIRFKINKFTICCLLHASIWIWKISWSVFIWIMFESTNLPENNVWYEDIIFVDSNTRWWWWNRHFLEVWNNKNSWLLDVTAGLGWAGLGWAGLGWAGRRVSCCQLWTGKLEYKHLNTTNIPNDHNQYEDEPNSKSLVIQKVQFFYWKSIESMMMRCSGQYIWQ